jgi:Tol biopolymer transport system component
MNMQKKIEQYLRTAPKPPAPDGLLDKLQADVSVQDIKTYRSSLHRWFAPTGQSISSWRVAAAAAIAIAVLLPLSYGATKLIKRFIGITIRQVMIGSGGCVSLSPDGKYLCNVDWDTGNLEVRELVTGNVRPLTSKTSWEESGAYAYNSAISRDSKKVAFLWWNSEREAFDLRTIGLDGSGNRVVRHIQEKEWFQPAAWSADHKEILGTLSAEDEPSKIIWVSTADGSVRTVKVLDGWPKKVALSSDGRYVAYDLPQEKSSSKRDIFVLACDEKREIPVVQNPANDKLLGWTPDGKYIFFTSDRTGSWDGWILKMVRGEPSGLPQLVNISMDNASPIGFTQGGSFYYELSRRSYGIYIASLDLETGEVLSSPKPVGYTGTEGAPDWSPDGKYLAYCTRPRDSKQKIIHIQSVKTGQERQLDANLLGFRLLRWCPDGRSILVTDFFQQKLQDIIYKIDVLTGERTVLLRTKTSNILHAALSPDGKTLFYSDCDRPTGPTMSRLMVRDLQTGSEKQLVRVVYGTAPYSGWALSPDGKQLAFVLQSKAERSLNTVSTTGGKPNELLRKKLAEDLRLRVAWTPDGQNILFFLGNELWQIPAEGGEARKLWEWKERRLSLDDIRVHPDGQNVALEVTEPRNEVWVMENFLPVE